MANTMKMKIMQTQHDFKPSFSLESELEDVDEVYINIEPEVVETLFREANTEPVNDEGYEDGTFVGGEIQFIFEKGTDEIDEILVFPVYSADEDEFINGDFINAPASVYDYKELIDDAKKFLKQATS